MPKQVQDLLRSCLMLAIEGGCVAFFIVFTCLSYRKIAQTWKRSLLFAGITSVLAVPSSVVALAHLDVARLTGGSHDLPPQVMMGFAIIGALLAVVIQFGCRLLYYHVAAVEWGWLKSTVRPAVSPRPIPWGGVAIGAAIGTIAAVVSMFIFAWWGVGEGDVLKSLELLFPGIYETPGIILVPSLLGTLVSAALVEEMIFRGGLLGLLVRVTHSQRGLAWLWIAATAVPWALLHWDNTNNPAFKIAQIFLLGLVFGWLALRWGLFSSMAAHVSLNVVVLALALLFPAMFASRPAQREHASDLRLLLPTAPSPALRASPRSVSAGYWALPSGTGLVAAPASAPSAVLC